MIEQAILCHSECWTLWSLDEKLISILSIAGHHIILMDQNEEQGVVYSLGVILDRIRISEEVANFVGVCHS